ncbi:FMN-dependent NADH-azoreductase [Sphingobium nicotianae]|uniref:FMN dependent NADH:quinone oxidoreductase n=1 Tax=Sphingobium nicotianae TaxID=2782607 RepID=A0A9X1DCF1_9SPHN|nr:NAD(P)H-dependent oxidoreductase [Sphingobium nicotianae]MBT2187562.1 NAD(P)H-dependent oxidoreductase [Sphingobium nicotianae]
MILHIDSSVLADNSVSRQLTAAIVSRLQAADPSATVVHRDLAAAPLPHFLPGVADDSVEQFLAANTVVIGAPMYNFSVPSQLKAWIDHILVAGKTFKYTEQGVVGLAGPKRIIVAVSRGGFYGAGSPGAAMEHLETYLRSVFAFIGLDPEFVVAEGIQVSPDHRATAIEGALESISQLAA